MKLFHLVLALVAAVFLSACSSKGLPSSVQAVSVSPSPRTAPEVLAPKDATVFIRMAEGEGLWAVEQLRASLLRELSSSQRFQAAVPGKGDANITIEKLRHGLVEVSSDSFAVSVTATVSIRKGEKLYGSHELDGMGTALTLRELEDPPRYHNALQSALDKIAIEFIATL